jgi:hypothetical protein
MERNACTRAGSGKCQFGGKRSQFNSSGGFNQGTISGNQERDKALR